jgi:hypothetical protein
VTRARDEPRLAEPATLLRRSRAILRVALLTLLPSSGQRGPINESVFCVIIPALTLAWLGKFDLCQRPKGAPAHAAQPTDHRARTSSSFTIGRRVPQDSYRLQRRIVNRE